MIIVHTIHVQYLCKGGTKLLQRQFERLLASKQLKRPPEGDLITYALPSISSVIHSYCKYQQVVCFFLLGVSAFQTEGVQVSHYTLTLLSVKCYCMKQSCWVFLLLSNLKERKELLHLTKVEKEKRETQPKRDDMKTKLPPHFL